VGIAEARARLEEQAVEHGILLAAVDARGARVLVRHADASHVQADEVRRQRDHRPAARGGGVQVLEAFHADEAQQLRLAPPHHDRQLDGVAPQHAEVPEAELVLLALAHFGKAHPQVHARHVPAPELVEQPTEPRADRPDPAHRQEVREPEDEDAELRAHLAQPSHRRILPRRAGRS
jgi:hypothetical protein